MSANAAIVRRGYEALVRGDLATLAEVLGDDVRWHTPGKSPLAGDAVGRDAVFARLGRYAAETGGTFTSLLTRLLTDEDGRVLGIHHDVAARCGKRLDVYSCTVFELEHGRIVEGRDHVYDLTAWDEFWS